MDGFSAGLLAPPGRLVALLDNWQAGALAVWLACCVTVSLTTSLTVGVACKLAGWLAGCLVSHKKILSQRKGGGVTNYVTQGMGGVLRASKKL